MTELLMFFLVLGVIAMTLATLRDVYYDGSRHPHPPRSHPPDAFEPRTPHRFA